MNDILFIYISVIQFYLRLVQCSSGITIFKEKTPHLDKNFVNECVMLDQAIIPLRSL